MRILASSYFCSSSNSSEVCIYDGHSCKSAVICLVGNMGPAILEQILVVLDIIVLYLNNSRTETASFPLSSFKVFQSIFSPHCLTKSSHDFCLTKSWKTLLLPLAIASSSSSSSSPLPKSPVIHMKNFS